MTDDELVSAFVRLLEIEDDLTRILAELDQLRAEVRGKLGAIGDELQRRVFG